MFDKFHNHLPWSPIKTRGSIPWLFGGIYIMKDIQNKYIYWEDQFNGYIV